MTYISNFDTFLEGKKMPPTSKAETSLSKPKEGGVVLIFSNPIFDKERKIYMSIINKVREDNETNTVRVDVTGIFYILKQHSNGIMPEKIGFMTAEDRLKILNMNSNGLYLNDNKTPLWQTSCGMNKYEFFTKCQPLLNDIKNRYTKVLIPNTNMTKLVNLHL